MTTKKSSSLTALDRAKFRTKISSLAYEAKFIRGQELEAKSRKDTKAVRSLYLHRVIDIRPEARSTLLAYAFLRGMAYERVEPTASSSVNTKRVAQIVRSLTRESEPQHSVVPLDIATWVGQRKLASTE